MMLVNLAENVQSGSQANEYHSAVVVDNKDPLRQHRIKALVEGRLEVTEAHYDRLPWLSPDRGDARGGRPDSTTVSVPPIRSEVKVRFINDDPYNGVYSGAVQSSSNTNTDVFDNYPEDSGSVSSDGTYTKSDPTRNTQEFFRRDGTFIQTGADGDMIVSIPRNILIRAGGDIRVKVDGEFNLVADNLNLKISDFVVSASGAVNFRATGQINMDAPRVTSNMGQADDSAALSAASTVNSDSAAVQTMTNDRKKTVSKVVERAREFNRTLYEKGTPKTNAKPTIGSTGNFSKNPLDDLMSLLGLGRGANLVARLIGQLPIIGNQNAVVQTGVGSYVALTVLHDEAADLAEAAVAYTPADLVETEALIDTIEAEFTAIAAAADPIAAITAVEADIVAWMADLDMRFAALSLVQRAYIRLPQIAEEARRVPASTEYGVDELRATVIALSTTPVTDISVPLAVIERDQISLAQTADVALTMSAVANGLTSLTDPDSTDAALLAIKFDRLAAMLGGTNV